jgi:hypothetical protein
MEEPKRRHPRKRKDSQPATPPLPAAPPPSADEGYETDVAPDLVDKLRRPGRASVPEAECSLSPPSDEDEPPD